MESKKRGLPEGFVRALEKLWGLAICYIPGIEEALLASLSEGLQGSKQYEFASAWVDDSRPDGFFGAWRASRLFHDLKARLSELESLQTPSKAFEASQRVLTGPYDAAAFAVPHAQSPSPAMPQPSPVPIRPDVSQEFMAGNEGDEERSDHYNHTGQSQAQVSGNSLAIQSSLTPISSTTSAPPLGFSNVPRPMDSWYPPMVCESKDDIQFPLPPDSRRLIDHYLKYTHLWLPIVERHELLRLSYTAGRLEIKRSKGERALLWALLAYTKSQCDIGDTGETSIEPIASTSPMSPQAMVRYAGCLVSHDDVAFDIGLVQALLLISLTQIGHGQWQQAWMNIGRATRIAVYLHLESPDASSPELCTGRSRQVFLCCFIFDTLMAAHLGLPPQISKEDLKHVEGIQEDGADEWEPWRGTLTGLHEESADFPTPSFSISTFNKLVDATKALHAYIKNDGGQEQDNIVGELLGCLPPGASQRQDPLHLGRKAPGTHQHGDIVTPNILLLHLTQVSVLLSLKGRQGPDSSTNHSGLSMELSPLIKNTVDSFRDYLQIFGVRTLPPLSVPLIAVTLDLIESRHEKSMGHEVEGLEASVESLLHMLPEISQAWSGFNLLGHRLECLLSNMRSRMTGQSTESCEALPDSASIHPCASSSDLRTEASYPQQRPTLFASRRPQRSTGVLGNDQEGANHQQRNLDQHTSNGSLMTGRLERGSSLHAVIHDDQPDVDMIKQLEDTVSATDQATTRSPGGIRILDEVSMNNLYSASSVESDFESVFQDFVTSDAMQW